MKLYKSLAPYYDLMFSKDYSREAGILYSILQGLGVRSGHLLDVGCGTGNHLKEFRRLGFSIEGLDSSRQMLEIARNKVPNIHLHKGNMEWMRLGERFEVITLLSRTLLFVSNYFWLKMLLKRLYNHLIPGGVLLMDLDIHEENFNPELSHSNYFREKNIEGSLMEDYELKKDKILWSVNLSIKDKGRLVRLVDDQDYLLINVHRLLEVMKSIGFRIRVYDLNGKPTTNHKQGLIFAAVRRTERERRASNTNAEER